MDKITIIENIKIDDDKFELAYKFKIPIPLAFTELKNKIAILKSYQIQYPSLRDVDDTHVIFVSKKIFDYTLSAEDLKSALIDQYTEFEYVLNALQVNTVDMMNGLVFDGVNWH